MSRQRTVTQIDAKAKRLLPGSSRGLLVRRVRGGHDLEQFVRRIPKGYKPKQLDWGPPVGRRSAGRCQE